MTVPDSSGCLFRRLLARLSLVEHVAVLGR